MSRNKARSGAQLKPGTFAPSVRGKPVPRDERERRMAAIARWYLGVAAHSVTETCRIARREIGCSDTTTKRYLRAIRAGWVEASQADRDDMRALHRAGIQADLAMARAAGKWSAVTTLRRLLAEIDGVLAPMQLDVTARRSPLDGLSLEQLERVAKTGRLPSAEDEPRRLNN